MRKCAIAGVFGVRRPPPLSIGGQGGRDCLSARKGRRWWRMRIRKKKGISREKKESRSKVKGKEWMDDAVNGTGRNHGKASSASKCHNRQRRQADDGSSSTRGRWWSQAETSVATLPVPRLHSPRQWRLSIAWGGLRRIADVAPLRIFCRHRVRDRDRRQHVWISKEGTPPILLLTCFSNRPKC